MAMERVCKAEGCGKTFMGASAARYCSDACRKKGMPKPKFVPEITLIKKEEIKPTLTLPKVNVEDDRTIKTFNSPLVQLTITEILNQLTKSDVMRNIITNIARKHKYKKAESFVHHIEDMLLIAED